MKSIKNYPGYVFLMILGFFLILYSCQEPKDELAYQFKDYTLDIQFVSDKIVRVQSFPKGDVPTHESLMVQEIPGNNIEWTKSEAGNYVMLSTSHLALKIDKQSGELEFLDKNEKLLLKE